MWEINWLAVAVVTIGSWMFGAIWYGPLWGNIWMRIHHGDKLPSAAEMKKLSEGMWKLLVTEFVTTTLLVSALAYAVELLPQFSSIHVALMIWFWFVVPMTVSGVIWWGDPKKWMVQKIFIMISHRLVNLVVAGYILSIW